MSLFLIPVLLAILQEGGCVTSLFRMNVNRNLVTVSGYSAGGTMAQHMFVSYSSKFSGLAVISSAYYRCGPEPAEGEFGNFTVYDAFCTKLFDQNISYLYNPANAILDIHKYYKLDYIDDPQGMANKPLYVFAGSTSFIFPLDVGLGVVRVLDPFINNIDAIQIRVNAANLTLPSDRRGFPDCSGPQNSLWISDCGFSAALDALQWILGKDKVRAPTEYAKLQPLLEFDQTEFFYGYSDAQDEYDYNYKDNAGMDTTGFFYVPTECRSYEKQCLLHFYFHGILTGREFVGSDHILNSGFLEVAEANNIIMIFPQAISSLKSPLGWWDTYGYLGNAYATQYGAQVTVIKNMLDRIIGLDEESYQQPQPANDYYSPAGAGSDPETPKVKRMNYIQHKHNPRSYHQGFGQG